jgi:arylsulfatase A-like enzyme
MISEVDAQLGRVVSGIEARGEWDETLVVVTSDHGEQLGDHGLIEKLGFFPQSYHIIGLWRDPRRSDAGESVHSFTENVDLLPSLADALGLDQPVQCDGRSLVALFDDPSTPWRRAAHYEWDFREYWIGDRTPRWPRDRSLNSRNLAASVSDELGYVQFGDGSFKCFDLIADPTWRTECADADRVLGAAQEQLIWRQEHMGRELTDMLLQPHRPGRWPAAFSSELTEPTHSTVRSAGF